MAQLHGTCRISMWARAWPICIPHRLTPVPTESTSAICAQRVQALPTQLLAPHRNTPSTHCPCLAPRLASSCIMEQQQQAAHSAHARLAVLSKHIAPVRLPVRRSPFCSEGARMGSPLRWVPAWAQPTSPCAAIAEAMLHLSRCCTPLSPHPLALQLSFCDAGGGQRPEADTERKHRLGAVVSAMACGRDEVSPTSLRLPGWALHLSISSMVLQIAARLHG